MKRRLAAALLIITLPLGMAACHGTKSRKATPSTPAPAATANANPTQAPGVPQAPGANPTQAPGAPQVPSAPQAPGASNQSVDEACGVVQTQMKPYIDAAHNDPSNTAQVLKAAESTVNGLNSAQIGNPDVKQAASKFAAALTDTINFSKKYGSNPNAADQQEAQRVTMNLTDSLLSLNTLCPSILDE